MLSPFYGLVLLITKEDPQIWKLSKFRIFRTFSELKLWFIFIYEHIANQNSVRSSVSIIFYKLAVQNVNKAFVLVDAV